MLLKVQRVPALLTLPTACLGIALVVLLGVVSSSAAREPSSELPAKVRSRLTLQTPVTDELLHELEKDFVDLLKVSRHADELLEAEDLLIATNDNTHWTNYSQAAKILRGTRDPSAIPLLLRYIVLHSRRSAAHIMIPEYVRSISLIAGKDVPDMYEAGPKLEERMREKVQVLYHEWWRLAKAKLATDPEAMSLGQLQVIAVKLLKQVRYDGDFSGSGGKRDTAYGAYHNVYYRLRSNDAAERHAIAPLHPAMLPTLLEPSGYRTKDQPNTARLQAEFPFEAVVIISELAKNGSREAVQEIADDATQNSTVRLICLLAIHRAGYVYETDKIVSLLESETDMERRLIMVLSLRWGNEQATTALLKNLDDANAEIATAAACALVDSQPRDAIPKLKKLLDRNFADSPTILLNAVAAFQSSETRALLETLLVDAVEGKRNTRHLSRILDAFVASAEIPRDAYRKPDDRDYHRQAQIALEYSREQSKRAKAEQTRMQAMVESLKTQLRVAQEIETLRRNELKRLLMLQGDEIVTAQASQRAQEQVRSAAAEVEILRTELREIEYGLEALNEKNR